MRIFDAMCHKLNTADARVTDGEGTRYLVQGTAFPSGV